MRIDKEKVKEKPRDKAEYFGEFSKTEIASLFPASELLQKIHADHVYTTNERSNDQSTDETDNYDYNHQDDIFSLNADSIQQVFQRMVNMTSLNSITDNQSRKDDSSTEESKSESRTPVIRRVKFVDDLPENLDQPSTSRDDPDLKDSGSKSRRRGLSGDDKKLTSGEDKKVTRCRRSRSNKSGRQSSITNDDDQNDKTPKKTRQKNKGTISSPREASTPKCKSVSEVEWKAANRCTELERELDTLIKYTAELLVRRWGEYLSMTTEKIAAFEIENAKQHKMVAGVIEMLEDKDRYVWQLIDELRFY